MSKRKQPAVVDLFCGVGGLSYGFVSEGFEIVAGIDNDARCKYSFEANNNSKFISKDVNKVSGKDIEELFGDDDRIKILVGCAPCQPFSSYSSKQKEKDESKWRLIYKFARLIEETGQSPDSSKLHFWG